MLLAGNFGLEKENVRTDPNGNLALTPHPEIFGDKAKSPYITTDFAESQIEMVTPTFSTPKGALDFMEALHDIVSLELKHNDEYLWPYSLPPVLPEDDNLIKAAHFNQPEITEYREYLAKKYGKRKQLLSGIHYNFSFSQKFMDALYSATGEELPYRMFNDEVYLKLSRFYLKYCWLIIYLFGANSVAHESYSACCKRSKQKITDDTYVFDGSSSFRNGVSGYRNPSYFYVSYNSLSRYVSNIHHAIQNGKIIAPKEYYSQIRLKGMTKGSILDDLIDNGITYVEIRTLDLNPLTKIGVTLEELDFVHLLLVYGLLAPDFCMSDEDYRLTHVNQLLAADANRTDDIMLHSSGTELKSLRSWGSELIDEMYKTFESLGFAADKLLLLQKFKQQLADNSPSIVEQIEQGVIKSGYAHFFMDKVVEYYADTQQNYAKFPGFQDLELSTQILLKEAIKRGVKFDFLDRQDNFIEFSNDGVTQLIKQATKTQLDNYISVLAMENKWVTKQLLTKHKIKTPPGGQYVSIHDALADYDSYKHKAIVIKPNSTNFGIGVTIFKNNYYTLAEYTRAIEIAFTHSSAILIEEFCQGKEYRFLVMEDKTIAVLHRDPANVVGDGINTVAQLVEQKNSDPLRGKGYVTPLEKISLGEFESVFLARQGLAFSYTPHEGEKVYLRENSNISTGGDSIDCTDAIGVQYKALAVACCRSVGAKICGVDILIQNVNLPPSSHNYTVVELNFNPAIHIHTYPYQGQDRKIAVHILKALNLID